MQTRSHTDRGSKGFIVWRRLNRQVTLAVYFFFTPLIIFQSNMSKRLEGRVSNFWGLEGLDCRCSFLNHPLQHFVLSTRPDTSWCVGWVSATISFIIILYSYNNGWKLSIWYMWSLSSRACPHARWTSTFGGAILGSWERFATQWSFSSWADPYSWWTNSVLLRWESVEKLPPLRQRTSIGEIDLKSR